MSSGNRISQMSYMLQLLVLAGKLDKILVSKVILFAGTFPI